MFGEGKPVGTLTLVNHLEKKTSDSHCCSISVDQIVFCFKSSGYSFGTDAMPYDVTQMNGPCFIFSPPRFSSSFTEPFLNLLMKEVIHPDSKAPVGIKLHFIDIYLEELAKVGAKEVGNKMSLCIAVLSSKSS